MKLNHDYVRDILLFIENYLDYKDTDSANPHVHREITNGQLILDEQFSNYNKSELSYALEKLIQAGFISYVGDLTLIGGNLRFVRINGLTWIGHSFLDDIRNDTIWNAVKEKSKNVGKVSITALAGAAGGLANAMMADPNALNNFLQGINNIKSIF